MRNEGGSGMLSGVRGGGEGGECCSDWRGHQAVVDRGGVAGTTAGASRCQHQREQLKDVNVECLLFVLDLVGGAGRFLFWTRVCARGVNGVLGMGQFCSVLWRVPMPSLLGEAHATSGSA